MVRYKRMSHHLMEISEKKILLMLICMPDSIGDTLTVTMVRKTIRKHEG